MSQAATITELQTTTLSALTRPQLQRYCSRLGLSPAGRKSILIARLQQAITARTVASATSTTTQTTTAGSLNSSTMSSVGTTTQTTTALPPLLSNLGPPGASVWLHSIAQQAAQTAVNQALSEKPSLPGPTPVGAGMNTWPTYTPQFGLTTPAGVSVNTAPVTSQTLGQTTPAISSSQASVYTAPSVALTPYMHQLQQSVATTIPSTTTITLLLPTLASHQPLLPAGASVALTGFNLPGELSGMLLHNTIQKILTLQFFDLATLLPSNSALLHDPQPIHLQVGGKTSQQLVLSRRPTHRQITIPYKIHLRSP